MTTRYGRCKGKISHNSKGKAEAAKRSLIEKCEREQQEIPILNVYACATCKGWHVGNQTEQMHKNKYAK